MRHHYQAFALASALLMFAVPAALAQEARYDKLANLPFKDGYVAKDNVPTLLDELYFERATQTYLWALPALNMYGMKEGSEKIFGAGYLGAGLRGESG